MFGKKNSLRWRSVDLVIDELVAAKEARDPKILWFWDDVFTIHPRWLKDFLPKFKERVGIPFWCYTYPTTHNLPLLKDIKEAVCNAMTIGSSSLELVFVNASDDYASTLCDRSCAHGCRPVGGHSAGGGQ